MNQEVLRNVNSQEHLETDCGKTFKTSNHFPGLCSSQRISNLHRSGVYKSYKTKSDEVDDFGQITPLCREYTLSLVSSQFRAHAVILEGQLLDQIIGPVIEVHIANNIRIWDLQSQFHLHPIPKRTSWGLISKGKSRFVNELRVSHQCGITLWTCKRERKCTLLGEIEDEHSGNWCGLRFYQETGCGPCQFFSKSSVLHEKIHTYDGKKVDNYSYLSIVEGGSLASDFSKMVTRLTRHLW